MKRKGKKASQCQMGEEEVFIIMYVCKCKE